jgi:hypothetical protein
MDFLIFEFFSYNTLPLYISITIAAVAFIYGGLRGIALSNIFTLGIPSLKSSAQIIFIKKKFKVIMEERINTINFFKKITSCFEF